MTIPQKVAQRMGTSKRSNADISMGMPPRDIGLISDSRPSLYPLRRSRPANDEA